MKLIILFLLLFLVHSCAIDNISSKQIILEKSSDNKIMTDDIGKKEVKSLNDSLLNTQCNFQVLTEEYDEINKLSFKNDANGGKISFKAKNNGVRYIVNDGIKEKYDWQELPTIGGPFSCIDGDNLLLKVRHKVKELNNGKYIIQSIDTGKYIGDEYEYIYDCSFVYTKDFKHFIFQARVDGKLTIIKDGKNILKDYGELIFLTFKDNKITPIVEKNGKQFIIQEQCNLELINK